MLGAMTDDSKPRVPLPAGYRQGVISAISVILGFSLLLLRYWSFEVSGEVTRAAVVAWLALLIALLLEFYALWRSLQVEDDDEREYRTTLRWFLTSIFALLGSLVLAALAAAKLVNF
jgi:Ca2+/Na+ antiporter